MAPMLPVVHVDRPLNDADIAHVDGRAEIVGPTDDELADAVAAVIGIGHRWDADRFARYPNLSVVSRMGVGYDNVDLAAARDAGVVVCNAPDAPTVSTAEHTLALILALAKELPAQRELADAGRPGKPTPTSLELDGAVLGLVGLGRIGQRVAVAAAAIGMRVRAYDPAITSPPPGLDGIELVDLDAVIRGSDVISLHAPAHAETRHLVGPASIARMKQGVYIVNCARGSLVDQEALIAALDSGHIAGAALDVTEPEPLPAGHPLLDRTDVIITPHVASGTRVGRRRLFAHAFENAVDVLSGRPASIVTDSTHDDSDPNTLA
ncbi:MAG: NAD(P)-dependent oxidoreductase [Acidimicrobiia bacterium]|nr:NAD(P)-dependent oxidoreductase [Acidimicrobiia bacterium]